MNILILGNQAQIVQHLEETLGWWGHDVVIAEDEASALKHFEAGPVDMVIADGVPAEIGALSLFRKIREAGPERRAYQVLLAEAQEGEEDPLQGLDTAADDYLITPLRDSELKSRVEVGARVLELERKIIRGQENMKRNYFQTIRMFNSLIEVFDEDLGGHSRRVGKLCRDLAARHPKVPEEDYQLAESAGLLHDIGMIGLPETILEKKRTERNENERTMYFSHPVRGEIIINEIETLEPVGRIVRAHHEQFNGRGFPDGLARDEIPVLAMIVSAASIFDNLVYRGNVDFEDIPQNIERMKGIQLDPYVAELLLDINSGFLEEEKKRDFRRISVSDLKEGMVLARDIRMKTGALAMPWDTQLDLYGIEKLQKFGRLECITGNVYVYKNSIRE